MRFRFWEYVFFASAFGAVALLPAALPSMPFLAVPVAAFTLALASCSLVAALALYGKRTPNGQKLLCALVAGAGALLLSGAEEWMPVPFVAWSVAAAVAVLTFGAILARRFFRRVERDFRHNFVHVMAVGIAVNAIGLTLAFFFAVFNPVFVGMTAAAVTLVSLL